MNLDCYIQQYEYFVLTLSLGKLNISVVFCRFHIAIALERGRQDYRPSALRLYFKQYALRLRLRLETQRHRFRIQDFNQEKGGERISLERK